MFLVTYSNELIILDEYFKESAISLGYIGNIRELSKSPTFIAKSIKPTWLNTPRALTKP
jgi:hypothetical protein